MVLETLASLVGAALAGAAGKQTAERILHSIRNRVPIARDISAEIEQRSTFGERLSDRVAKVGGSWAFVSGFCVVLAIWACLNLIILPKALRFDPYPFIFLNLLLSMLAAIQAPIIMMSQNRQSAIDRIESRHDFEVNLKAELEIMALHEKLERLHQEHGEQLALLVGLLTPPANPDRNVGLAQGA